MVTNLKEDILKGFRASRKSIPSKYFYDEKGSEIFSKITELDEYYLSKSEMEIIKDHSQTLAAVLDLRVNLIELGAGDGAKSLVLMRELMGTGVDLVYHAFDISESALTKLKMKIHDSFFDLPAHFKTIDFEEGLEIMNRDGRQNVILFLGSSIGNMTFEQSVDFLRGINQKLNPGDIWLIGFDLVKEISVMEKAYNDDKGLTCEFNLHLLDRINTELGTELNRCNFTHVEYFDPKIQSMVSYLRSKQDQEIEIDGEKIKFWAGEDIHTEFSFKYDQCRIQLLAEATGMEIVWQKFDQKKYFTLVAMRV